MRAFGQSFGTVSFMDAPPSVMTPYLNVSDFGARADGSDAAPAINRALESAQKDGRGLMVVFPGERYVVQSPIAGGLSGIELIGMSRRGTKLINNGPPGSPLLVIPDNIRGYTVSNMWLVSPDNAGQGPCIQIGRNFGEVRLINLEISANGASAGVAQSAGVGLHLYMENVRVNGGRRCFDLQAPAPTQPINTLTARNCYANSARENGWCLSNITQVVLQGCSADNCGSLETGYGFRLQGIHSALSGCTAENNGRAALPGGGYSVPSGVSAVFTSCSAYNQGQAWDINSAAHVTLIGCHAQTPIPYGSALGIAGGASVVVMESVLPGLDTLPNFVFKLGSAFYSTDGL